MAVYKETLKEGIDQDDLRAGDKDEEHVNDEDKDVIKASLHMKPAKKEIDEDDVSERDMQHVVAIDYDLFCYS